jgi:hypothetical protein
MLLFDLCMFVSYSIVKKKKDIETQQEDLEAQLKFAESVRDAHDNADQLRGQLEWAEVINLEKVGCKRWYTAETCRVKWFE